MNPLMMSPWIEKNPGPFRVGDRVAFLWGTLPVEATIVEDRGNLGEGGKRLYGIKFRLDDVSDEVYTEVPPEELQLVSK